MNNMMQVAISLPFAQARDGGTFAIIYPLMILKAFAVAALLDHHSSVRKKLSEEALVFFKALILQLKQKHAFALRLKIDRQSEPQYVIIQNMVMSIGWTSALFRF
jgi:hypothetical protein